MFAVVETGGKQYKVAPGDQLDVERLEVEAGQQLDLGRVLLVSNDSGQVTVGNPTVDGARVVATVITEHRGDKLIIFKYKAKKRYRRKNGHRQTLTRVSIDNIVFGGEDNRQSEAVSTQDSNELLAPVVDITPVEMVDTTPLETEPSSGPVSTVELPATETSSEASTSSQPMVIQSDEPVLIVTPTQAVETTGPVIVESANPIVNVELEPQDESSK